MCVCVCVCVTMTDDPVIINKATDEAILCRGPDKDLVGDLFPSTTTIQLDTPHVSWKRRGGRGRREKVKKGGSEHTEEGRKGKERESEEGRERKQRRKWK